MTDCPNAEMRDRLPDLLHEQLDSSARAAVLAHVADCQDCRAELTVLRESRVVLSSGVRVVDVATIARIVVELVPAIAPVRTGRGRWMDWRIAASVLFLAVGGTSLVMLRAHAGAERSAVTPVAVVQPVPEVGAGAPPAPESVASTSAAARQQPELSAAVAVSDLSDSELRALVDDLQTLDALPPTDPEPVSVRVALPEGSE